MKSLSVLLALLLFILRGTSEYVSLEPNTFEERLKEAKRILSETPLIDGHNDLGLGLHGLVNGQLKLLPYGKNSSIRNSWVSDIYYRNNLPLLKEGLVATQFWNVWVPCQTGKVDAVLQGLEQIDSMKSLMDDNSKDLQFVDTAEGIFDAFVDEKIGSLIGVEGGHMINSSLAVLRSLYQAGARYMTLTHTCSTPWAESAHERKNEGENEGKYVKGLSHYGRLVIDEMNRLGMIIDLSHASQTTIRDVYTTSAAPVIFSHSSAYALCNDSRNIPDNLLRDLKANGGVIMVNFSPELLTCSDNATLQDIIDHINHIKNVSGVHHVGLGSNFNRFIPGPEGMENVSKYPHLFAELLLDPEWGEEEIKMLAGFNFLRVFHTVESVKKFLKSELPVENIIIKDVEEDETYI